VVPDIWVAVAMGWPFGCYRPAREPCFSPGGGLVDVRVPRAPAVSARGTTLCKRSATALPLFAASAFRPSGLPAIPLEHEGDRRVDRQVGRIRDRGIGGGFARHRRPSTVARVARPEFMQKTLNISRYSFVDQLFKVASPNGRPAPGIGAPRGRCLGVFRAGAATGPPPPAAGRRRWSRAGPDPLRAGGVAAGAAYATVRRRARRCR